MLLNMRSSHFKSFTYEEGEWSCARECDGLEIPTKGWRWIKFFPFLNSAPNNHIIPTYQNFSVSQPHDKLSNFWQASSFQVHTSVQKHSSRIGIKTVSRMCIVPRCWVRLSNFEFTFLSLSIKVLDSRLDLHQFNLDQWVCKKTLSPFRKLASPRRWTPVGMLMKTFSKNTPTPTAP